MMYSAFFWVINKIDARILSLVKLSFSSSVPDIMDYSSIVQSTATMIGLVLISVIKSIKVNMTKIRNRSDNVCLGIN